ncbi:MAG: POTRA domain-containing protein [Pyrinomonadaceae bacterium]
MKNLLKIAALVIMLLPLPAIAAPSQRISSETCKGLIYDAREVKQGAKITEPAKLDIISQAFASEKRARIIVDAVLCRSGRVTDIKVIEISRAELADFVIGAISELEFKPAEMNWHTVSQRQRFEFYINDKGELQQIYPPTATGRLIEEIDIMGNRRFTKDEILSWIKVRPGDVYDEERIKKDFDAVLATGYFDKLTTRVFMEDAVRGGVRVVFDVTELPVIGEIKFVGIDQAQVLEAWRNDHIDLRSGAVYDFEKVKAATMSIHRLLTSTGQDNLKVKLQSKRPVPQTINLTFVVAFR